MRNKESPKIFFNRNKPSYERIKEYLLKHTVESGTNYINITIDRLAFETCCCTRAVDFALKRLFEEGVFVRGQRASSIIYRDKSRKDVADPEMLRDQKRNTKQILISKTTY